MKILIVDEWIPYPLDSGKKLRTFHLLKRLADKYDITILCYGKLSFDKAKVEYLKELGIKVILVEDNRIRKWSLGFYMQMLLEIFSTNPFTVNYHYSKNMQEQIFSFLEKEDFDLVQCEWTPYAKYFDKIDRLPKILSAHNVEWMQWKRFFQCQANPLKKIYAYLQWKRMFNFEKRECPKFDHCVAVSKKDADLLLSYGAKAASVVENGVDIAYFTPLQTQVISHSMVFTASMDAFSNQDGVEYFVKSIFPKIKQALPSVSFTAVGRNPSKNIYKLAEGHPEIKITGTVNDVRPFIAESSLYIVPLRVGGGSRLKILEAMAMGKAVISTTMGVEGLEMTPNKNVIIADKPEDFAQKAIELLSSRELCQNLGSEGRKLIEEKYSWDKIAGKLGEVWEKAIKQKKV